jgi:hypothetical protein
MAPHVAPNTRFCRMRCAAHMRTRIRCAPTTVCGGFRRWQKLEILSADGLLRMELNFRNCDVKMCVEK